MTFTYEFAQQAPCSVVIIFTKQARKMDVLLTQRDKSVGEGKSLSAGGFDETAEMLSQPVDTIIDGRAETYREAHEELGKGFKDIISYEDFERRVKYLWDFSVVKENQLVNKVVARFLQVTKGEMKDIFKLSPTSEQKGKMLLHVDLTDAGITKALEDLQTHCREFKNPEEIAVLSRFLEEFRP